MDALNLLSQLWYSLYSYHTFLAVICLARLWLVDHVKQTMIFLVLQSHQFRTDDLGEYNLMVTVNSTSDQMVHSYQFPLDDENVTHIVLASYNNGSLAFIEVSITLSNIAALPYID